MSKDALLKLVDANEDLDGFTEDLTGKAVIYVFKDEDAAWAVSENCMSFDFGPQVNYGNGDALSDCVTMYDWMRNSLLPDFKEALGREIWVECAENSHCVHGGSLGWEGPDEINRVKNALVDMIRSKLRAAGVELVVEEVQE